MRPDIITAKPWLLGQPRMSALPPCGVKQTDVNRGIGAEPVGAFYNSLTQPCRTCKI